MRFDRHTARKAIRAGWILLFLMAILGAVGEYRRWWNKVGELLVTVGTVGGLVLGGIDYVQAASEDQAEMVQDQLGSMDGKLARLEPMDGKPDSMDGKLDSMDGKLDRLNVIEAALIEEEGEAQVSNLDVVQTELDRQTGVLGRQVQLLGEIRDRL